MKLTESLDIIHRGTEGLQKLPVFIKRRIGLRDDAGSVMQGVDGGESWGGLPVAPAPRQQPDLAGQSSPSKQNKRLGF